MRKTFLSAREIAVARKTFHIEGVTNVTYNERIRNAQNVNLENFFLNACTRTSKGETSLPYICSFVPKNVLPVDGAIAKYCADTIPDFMTTLLRKARAIRPGKNVMVLATGCTMTRHAKNTVLFMQLSAGQSEMEYGTIEQDFVGCLQNTYVYEMVQIAA